ncbi:MarR family transcriptional regulator [Conexibacter sp. CPCC 206217]|uniref:MarR family transcriptional regulator n=1 Tax=Conexibacter sp. CPCC 206217 TaxID=3064574 RepID=UPI002720FA31|nr:MarR family transcriptional regulator [Conexibacter sp. CPCC 206217]MDO8208869.1 MarR family transcriptional regulator [Conexibacter sp. CPCC 206217]
MATADKQNAPALDPVAEVVRLWRSHGMLAIEHLEAATAMMRMQQLMTTSIDRELRPFRINNPQFEALLLLYFSPNGAVPLGRMGRRLMVHPATVTNTIDQLQSKGLVERVRSEEDRRLVFAKLTPRGHKVVIGATEALTEMKFGIAEMTLDEATAVAQAISAFRTRIGDYAE